MATFSDTIKLIFDVDKNAGTSALKNFSSDFQSAEGVSGKFKVAAGGALDYAKDHAAQLAAMGGAALIAFGVKAVAAFEETALAARNMGTATGLSVEESSRWIAIADDMGISAGEVSKSFLAIIKGLDKKAWAEYGVAVQDAQGKIKPTNELMLEAFDVLQKIPAGSERASAGNKLFGKSYADLSPMIGKTREEIEKQLAAVEKGQVVTAEESERAERLRKAQDQLSDAVKEVTLAVGGYLAKLAPAIEATAAAITKATEWYDALDKLPAPLKAVADGVQAWINPVGKAKDFIDDLTDSTFIGTETTGSWTNKIQTATDAVEHHGMANADAMDKIRNTSIAMAEAATAAGAVQRGLDNTKASWDALSSDLKDQSAVLDLTDSFGELHAKALLAIEATKNGSADAETKQRDYQRALIDTKQKVIDYAKEVGGLPVDVVTKILADIDNGSLASADAALNRIARDRQVIYNAQVAGHREYDVPPSVKGPGRAGGGPTSAGTMYPIGENGRSEVLTEGGRSYLLAGGNGAISTLGGGSSGGGAVVNLHYHGTVIKEADAGAWMLDKMIDLVKRGVYPSNPLA